MMYRFRFVLSSLCALALLASCGNGEFDPMDPTLDGAHLEIVGSPAVNLRYGESVDLRVRYLRSDGTAIENAPIDYALVGEAGGSRLGALQTPTDVNGEASIGLTAGSSGAMFTVEVTPPRGDAVSFSVAVSDTDAGSIVVSMTYAGSRDLVRFDTFLFDGESCAMMDPTALPTAVRSAPSVSSVTEMPAFAGVAPGTAYAVAVVARNATDVAAFGCRDGVAVEARAETPVAITLMDTRIGLDFTGVWDLDNHFDFAEGLPPSVRSAIDILDELTDDQVPPDAPAGESFCYDPPTVDPSMHAYGQDPGAFIVDVLARQTCHWECGSTETYDTCSETNHRLGDLRLLCVEGLGTSSRTAARFRFGCGAWDTAAEPAANLINRQIDRLAPTWVTDWLTFAGDLSRAMNSAQIASVLTINRPSAGSEFELPMTHELISMHVVLHDPLMGGMERAFDISLADAGITSAEVMGITTVDGANLTIPEHSFRLSFGRLVQYIYTELFLHTILGYANSEEMLRAYVDCASIGSSLAMSVGILSETQYTNACNSGLTAVGRLLDTRIAGLIDADATFTIQGTAVGMDVDEMSGRVGTLSNGMWTGHWGESSMTANLTGTFTGTRRTGM